MNQIQIKLAAADNKAKKLAISAKEIADFVFYHQGKDNFPDENQELIVKLFTIEDYASYHELYDSLIDSALWLRGTKLKEVAINFLNEIYHRGYYPVTVVVNGLKGGYISTKFGEFLKNNADRIIGLGFGTFVKNKLTEMYQQKENRNAVTGEVEVFNSEKLKMMEELISVFTPETRELSFQEQAALLGKES